MKKSNQNNISIFSKHPNLQALFLDKESNNDFYEYQRVPSQIFINHSKAIKNLGLDDDTLICHTRQMHTDHIAIIKKQQFGKDKVLEIPNTDAVITDEKNIALMVYTADCLPIYIFDKKKNVIALVHA